ncbi:MAG TPA: hypothetical protein VHV78_08525 [Gemmatimonadaceae bacterium]|jgi:hypothetical protein|nr:hypothetical protein [Gemmatimonadaceae bacterium]
MTAESGALNKEASLVRAVGVRGLAASIVDIAVDGGIFRLPADARGAGDPFLVPFAAVIPVVAVAIIVCLLTSLTAGGRKSLPIVLGVAVVTFAGSVPTRRAVLTRERA